MARHISVRMNQYLAGLIRPQPKHRITHLHHQRPFFEPTALQHSHVLQRQKTQLQQTRMVGTVDRDAMPLANGCLIQA